MTHCPPMSATGRGGVGRLGCQPCTSSVSRWLGALLAVALFGVDAFQPVIGLVEVGRDSRKARPAEVTSRSNKPQARTMPEPVAATIQAWQWQQSCSELWPVFLFQPTINAGSGGSVWPTGSKPFGSSLAALPPTPLVWSLPAPAVLCWLAAPLDGAYVLRVAWCREICPVGPPLV